MVLTNPEWTVRVRANYTYIGFGSSIGAQHTAQVFAGTNVSVGASYTYSGFEHVTTPQTRVAIDPNVRVRGNGTYAGFEDVDGPMAVGDDVQVYEPESGLVGEGRVTEIDRDRELIYLSVDWSTLTDEEPPQQEFSPAAQLLYLPSTYTLEGGVENEWMRLVPRPCLAYLSWSDSVFSVTAPALTSWTGLLSHSLEEPLMGIWQINDSLKVAA